MPDGCFREYPGHVDGAAFILSVDPGAAGAVRKPAGTENRAVRFRVGKQERGDRTTSGLAPVDLQEPF